MLNQLKCPYCNSETHSAHKRYETVNNGSGMLYKCATCGQVFSETKGSVIEGLKKPLSLIAQVLKARSEGMGFNAACRVFEIAKNTLLNWERRLSGMKETLMLYALLHTFISQEIEGDEAYTRCSN